LHLIHLELRFRTIQFREQRFEQTITLGRVVRRVLVYLGDQRLRTEDGIEVWPLPAVLDAVANDTLWP
jgi:hypothetical protein